MEFTKLIFFTQMAQYAVIFAISNGGTIPFFPKLAFFFGTCHNFFSLSSVQIIIIPACCLLCVL